MAHRKTLEFLVPAVLVLGGGDLAVQAQQRPAPENPLFLPDVSPSPLNPPSRARGDAATRTAQLTCLAMVVKAFEQYRGPAEARELGEGAFFMSCVIKEMPADWADRGVMQRHAAELAADARRADPAIDSCLLTACIVDRSAAQGRTK